jgi:hypothetical protein
MEFNQARIPVANTVLTPILDWIITERQPSCKVVNVQMCKCATNANDTWSPNLVNRPGHKLATRRALGNDRLSILVSELAGQMRRHDAPPGPIRLSTHAATPTQMLGYGY